MNEMRDRIVANAKRHKTKSAEFLRQLIATPSDSGNEEAIALIAGKEMQQLNYDNVEVDRFGNVIGRIGNGRTKVLFDAQMDTTGIGDRSSWRFDPYAGDMKAGKVYGHGAANNKGGLAAVIYAGAIIKDLDLATDCTVYIVGSVQAQECEGAAYKAIFDVDKLYPNFVILTAPTGMRICRGQRGRAEIAVTLRGQPAHASAPDKGYNAIYGMTDIIAGVKALNEKLPSDKLLGKATIAVTHVECDYNGPNALPEACRITIDRRLLPDEEDKKVLQQVKTLCKGTRAKIEFVEFDRPSYRGLRLPMQKFLPSWTMDEKEPLIQSAEHAYRTIFKKAATLDCWTMSTAGVYTRGVAGIPTIGFGPAEESFSGPVNDHCRIDDMEKCMAFYATLLGYLPDAEPIRPPRRR